MLVSLGLTIEQFAARRRDDQSSLEEALTPFVDAALGNLREGDAEWDFALLEEIDDWFFTIYEQEGGQGAPRQWTRFRNQVEKALEETTEESSSDRIAVWLATAILNAATSAAAANDPEPIVMEWVTMEDDAVRHTHKEANGQQRPPGENFTVGGEEMPYPGFPGVSPALWMNCRCALAPTYPSEEGFHLETASGQGETMTASETEQVEETEAIVPSAIPWHGILAPEDEWSGDGRRFAAGALTFRDLPLPLTWQKISDDGHKGSVVVARIDHIQRVGKEMRAFGMFLQSVEADEVIGMIAEFGRFGVSVDADDAEMEFDEDSQKVTFTKGRIASASIVPIPAFAQAWVALGTPPEDFFGNEDMEALVASAEERAEEFRRGKGWVTHPDETRTIHKYWTQPGQPGYIKIGWGTPGDFNRCRTLVGEKIAKNSPEDMRFLNNICAEWHHDALGIWPGEHKAAASDEEFVNELVKSMIAPVDGSASVSLVASADQIKAPAAWFANPNLDKPTHLTITPEGRVFGHIAQWGVCHIGFEGVCVDPPHSASNYAYFASGSVLLDDDTYARTGVLSIGGGHANGHARWRAAIEHYDSTSAAVADVAVGEDDHGIWCAGWVRPGVSDEMVVALRASDISGDWREVVPGSDQMELVAALGCNVNGFPIRVAASNGRQISLVAAGVLRSDPATTIQFDMEKFAEAVADALEAREQARQERQQRAEALKARVGATEGE